MRLIYVAPQHSYFHYSGYSSEPFLAEAAAHACPAGATNIMELLPLC